MKLFELDPRNPIDRELEKTASNAGKNGSLDPDDIEDQEQGAEGMDDVGMDDMGGDPMGGPENAPDGPMGGAPAPEPAPPAKPVDSALMSRVQTHDYIQRYSHNNPDSETNPINIMNMDMGDLGAMRDRIRGNRDRIEMADDTDGKRGPEKTALNDMLSFVDIIMAHKKQAAKNDRTTSADKPTIREKPPSKTEPGKQFKAKRS